MSLMKVFPWFLVGLSFPSFASDWTAEILPSQEPNETVKAIYWKELTVPIEVIPKGTDFESRVELSFSFDKLDWSLIKDSEQLHPIKKETSDYLLSLPLTSEVTSLEIIAIGPMGEVEMQKVLLRVPDWLKFRREGAEAPPKRTYLFSSLGIASISFQEQTAAASIVDFSMLTSSLKFAYQYFLTPPQLEFGANAFINLIPFQKKGIDNTVRFLGVNFRFGYVFQFIKPPSRLSFLVGGYYTTMLGTNAQFGYKTLLYPQYYPTYRHRFRKGGACYIYLKYVPLTQGFGLSLTDREWAMGAGLEIPRKNGNPISISVDTSDFKLNLNNLHQLSSKTLSLSVGFGW